MLPGIIDDLVVRDEENNILFDNKKAGEWLKSKINGKED